MTPFRESGPSLLAQGYSALPIVPGDKVPGTFDGAEWRMMRGWSKFCGSLPPAFQAKAWASWPNAGVGVACGRGLVLVDIDLEEAVGHVMAALPPANVAKKGAKGLTLCFRGDTSKIRSRAFRIDGIGAVDLLADGKQSVLPPSIHPRTGNPYVWMTARTLLDTPLSELPELPDDVADVIAEALRPLGYKAEATFEFDGVVRDSASQSTDFFRRLNDDALANLDAWVPKLALPRLIRQSGGGWRGVPFWRPSSTGTPTNKRKLNLSFDPKGIRDFGDGGRAYTPLNVVLAACDLSEGQIDTAAKWLGEWIGYDFSVKIDLVPGANAPSRLASEPPAAETVEVPQSVAEISEPAPEPVSPPRPTLVGGNLAAMMADIPEDDDEDDVFEPAAAPEASGPATADWRLERYRKLEALTHVPGLVGQMIDWIVNCSEKPSRVLALGAALTAVGALAGRWYDSPTHLRTNLYIANLAASGFGKDHARKCILALFHEHGMDRLLGGSKIMSGSALRKQVEQSPSTFYLLDEFGSMLRDIYDRRAGTHTKQIRDYLLEFYSSASTYFNGADYAGEKGTKIYNPNVAVYGTSTPIDFWSSMSSGGVADGFLARMIVMSVDGPRPRSSKPPSKMLPVPRPIVDMCHEIMTPKGGNLSGATHDGTTKIEPVNIPFVGEAEALWYALCNECDDEADVAPPELHPIYNRLAENAQKLATVLAIGMNPTAPVIDCDTLEWGFELAWLCAEGAMDEVQGRLADNERQREYLDVKRHIQLAGPEGITKTKLTRLVNGRVDTRRFDDILTMLGNANDIEIKLWQSPKGGPPGARFVFKPEAPRRRKVS